MYIFKNIKNQDNIPKLAHSEQQLYNIKIYIYKSAPYI
jgi:hypothetical protein